VDWKANRCVLVDRWPIPLPWALTRCKPRLQSAWLQMQNFAWVFRSGERLVALLIQFPVLDPDDRTDRRYSRRGQGMSLRVLVAMTRFSSGAYWRRC